jgi:hypothetical protein
VKHAGLARVEKSSASILPTVRTLQSPRFACESVSRVRPMARFEAHESRKSQ